MKQMKLAMAILIALAMATPALAFNVEWHGDFNNRFSYSTQEDLSNEIFKDQTTYYSFDGVSNVPTSAGKVFKKEEDDSGFIGQIKYRTRIEASDDEKKVKGVLGIEVGTLYYGDSSLDLGGDAKGQFELQWAYTDIELPFDPASRVVVGLQPAKYNLFVWSDNAAGIKWNRKEGRFAYSLAWFRTDWDGRGGDDNEEGDIYAGDLTYKLDNGKLNTFVIVREQGVDEKIETGSLVEYVRRDTEIWFGLSGDYNWGDLSVMATGVYLTGEATTTAGDLDRQAYLFHAQGDYKVGKNTFTLGGAYVSGDDDPNDNDLDNFDHIDITTSVLGSVVVFDNYSDDDSLSDSFYAFDKGFKLIYAGVARKLNAKTKVWAKYFWHNSAEDLADGEDEIGHEFVVGASYTIMKGLTADINAGYLVAGKALDALTEGDDADDVFRTDARIRFKF